MPGRIQRSTNGVRHPLPAVIVVSVAWLGGSAGATEVARPSEPVAGDPAPEAASREIDRLREGCETAGSEDAGATDPPPR